MANISLFPSVQLNSLISFLSFLCTHQIRLWLLLYYYMFFPPLQFFMRLYMIYLLYFSFWFLWWWGYDMMYAACEKTLPFSMIYSSDINSKSNLVYFSCPAFFSLQQSIIWISSITINITCGLGIMRNVKAFVIITK